MQCTVLLPRILRLLLFLLLLLVLLLLLLLLRLLLLLLLLFLLLFLLLLLRLLLLLLLPLLPPDAPDPAFTFTPLSRPAADSATEARPEEAAREADPAPAAPVFEERLAAKVTDNTNGEVTGEKDLPAGHTNRRKYNVVGVVTGEEVHPGAVQWWCSAVPPRRICVFTYLCICVFAGV